MGIENIGSGLAGLGTGLNKLDELNDKVSVEKSQVRDSKMPVDWNDEEIKPGYTVAYAVLNYRSAALRVAVVDSIGQDKYGTATIKILVDSAKTVYEKYPDGSRNYNKYQVVTTKKRQSVQPAGRMIIVKRG